MSMPGALNYYFGDLYPGATIEETSTQATPNADDQIAMNESKAVSEDADTGRSKTSSIFLAIGLVVILVVVLGVD